MTRATESLGRVRERIDALDDRIHDLLMERISVVQSVNRAKSMDRAPIYRPGREARILRRLVGRHQGRFPMLPLVRIWREIIAASLGLQGGFTLAVYAGDGAAGYRDAARDHFGAATPITAYQSYAGVINAVTGGRAAAGVLPFPGDGQAEPWWSRMLQDSGPSIVARIPFAPPSTRSSEARDALVIAASPPDPSDDDHSFVVLRTGATNSRGRINNAFRSLSLEPRMTLSLDDSTNPETSLFLIEVASFIEPEDRRIPALLADLDGSAPGIRVLGAYARPFTQAELRGATFP